MKKLTLLSMALAFMSLTASADDVVIYEDNFTDEATTLANWTTSREGSVVKFVNTPSGGYIQFGDGAANYNGTRHNSFWGTAAWGDKTVPETGYTFKFAFNFAQFGNQSSNAAQRNNEFAVVSAEAADTTGLSDYYGNSVTKFPGYLFKLTQCLSGTQAGEGGVCTSTTGTCFFTVNNDADSVNVAAATWYYVTLNIVGQNVDYSIVDINDVPLKSGSYILPEGADNRVGGIIHYQARYLGISQVMGVRMFYETDEDVAQKPMVTLYQVVKENRIYKAVFNEDEVLHYVLPDGTTGEVDYWDAEDDVTGDVGVYKMTVTQSGTLQVWTTKNDAVSEKVEIPVECGLVTLVDPEVAISNVKEGYAKSYTVTIDNEKVLLTPTIALTYSIKYDNGESEEGEVANGGILEVKDAGTMTITANSIPVNGVEYYGRSSVTIVNNVEYVVAQDVNYQEWTADELSTNPAFEYGELVDTNTSHWIGHWMNTMDENGNPLITDENTPLPIYTLINDEAGENYAKALLPLKMNTARGNIAILLEEGIFINGTSYNNGEVYFDENYITDDPSKPNFMEITKTGSYDRYDKQETCHSVDIVKTDVTTYTLYRFDTAINRARVFTYKGFVPGSAATGISDVTVNKVLSADAPIYNLSGVRVDKNSLTKGLYIQNGKKFVVK